MTQLEQLLNFVTLFCNWQGSQLTLMTLLQKVLIFRHTFTSLTVVLSYLSICQVVHCIMCMCNVWKKLSLFDQITGLVFKYINTKPKSMNMTDGVILFVTTVNAMVEVFADSKSKQSRRSSPSVRSRDEGRHVRLCPFWYVLTWHPLKSVLSWHTWKYSKREKDHLAG